MGTMAPSTSHERGTFPVTLPDHIIEKVVSLMPFPSLLKARSLSKDWYSTFTSNPPVGSSLQDQVRSVCRNWSTFCPAYINSSHQLVGYDSFVEDWVTSVSLCFLPLLGSICQFTGYASSLEGPLLCSTINPESGTFPVCSPYEAYFKSDLYITNVITGDWKYLPPRPNMQQPRHVEVLPLTTRGDYRVVTVTHPVTGNFGEGGSDLLQIYDSRRDSWELKQTDVTTSYLDDLGGVFLEDKYYILYRNEDILLRTSVIEHIMICNIKDGKSTKLSLDSLPLRPDPKSFDFGIVKARESVILVAVGESEFHMEVLESPYSRSVDANSIFLFELEPKSLTFKQIAVGPPSLVENVSMEQMIGHKNRIFLAGSVSATTVVFCDVYKQQWGILPLPSNGICAINGTAQCFAFEPGLNPFMLV